MLTSDDKTPNPAKGSTYQATIVREVSTTYKFYVAPGQDPHEAFDAYIKAVDVQRIIRTSEPRKV